MAEQFTLSWGSQMSLTWVIDHRTRMVVATGAGTLRLEDFEAALDELARPATLSYRKLVDLTDCSSALGTADMLDLNARIRGYGSLSALGALAIVAASDENYRQARLFEALDGTDRPMKIFRDIAAARDWLDGLPSSASRYGRLFDEPPEAEPSLRHPPADGP
jgi:hypothetical protein